MSENSIIAVIGGSGAYDLLKTQSLGQEINCKTLETPFGSSVPIHQFESENHNFYFLSRHGETDYSLTASFVNYRANIYALKECGAQRIISWSGPGIINKSFRPGEFIVPHDVIDETKKRETTFFKNRGYGFIRQKEPFCPDIRWGLHETFHKLTLPHHENGVYVCTEGPRLESPAEIRKFRIFGADLVGMTLIPEMFLARELEMCYASICYLTNYAEGIKERDFKVGQLFEGMQTEEEKETVNNSIQMFPKILSQLIEFLLNKDIQCDCQKAMQRYREKGMIGDNWKTWIGTI